MKRKVAKKSAKKTHKKTHRKVSKKKTTKKASSPKVAQLRKEYNVVKRAYKEIGRKLGRATGVTK